MVTLLIAAAIATLAPAAPAPVPPAPATQPAMWVVNDEDTVIYLFGTFHALDGRTPWFSGAVRTAFDSSGELVLETVIPAPHAPQDAVRTTSSFRPNVSFLASTRLALSAGHSRGLSFEMGADAVLRRAADAAGKSVSGIESFDSQLQMFTRIPPADSVRLAPQQTRPAMDSLAHTMTVMQNAWARGESDIFADMLDDMRIRLPDTYRMLFVERNARWADWISDRLDRPGTVFVAVGAGHLAGSDSVQNRLAQKGIRSARIN